MSRQCHLGLSRCTLDTNDMARQQYFMFALCGMTGAGKTSFASLASGREHLKIGHRLKPCMILQSLHFGLNRCARRTANLLQAPKLPRR